MKAKVHECQKQTEVKQAEIEEIDERIRNEEERIEREGDEQAKQDLHVSSFILLLSLALPLACIVCNILVKPTKTIPDRRETEHKKLQYVYGQEKVALKLVRRCD